MSLYRYSNQSVPSSSQAPVGPTEFDVLKASHKFLRDEEEEHSGDQSWEDRLAQKYYSSLYREYAVCDLKHYKSGNFSLRWRTEDEVISGAGETTCGNTRCPFHEIRHVEKLRPALKTLELPFSYSELGESKFALVKVVLCDKCVKKLMWKRNKEKKESSETVKQEEPDGEVEGTLEAHSHAATIRTSTQQETGMDDALNLETARRGAERRRKQATDPERQRRHSSRSRSPSRRKSDRSRRRRSPT